MYTKVFNKVIHRKLGANAKPKKIKHLPDFSRKELTRETQPLCHMTADTQWIEVAVATPAHSGMDARLVYSHTHALVSGQLVRVPLGSREVLGVVWGSASHAPQMPTAALIKPIAHVLTELPPLGADWRQLVAFAAQYYQRSLGDMALSCLPPALRALDPTQVARRLKKHPSIPPASAAPTPDAPTLTPQQSQALEAMAHHPGPYLLFGATGSGKTEVYLQAIARALAAQPQGQALVLVPEINLTPQLLARVQARFGAAAVVAMHSGMTPAQRLHSWLAAHLGHARIVLGTRMAVLASLPHLRLIVVDEEHDASYKQQEGARYSARDLALYRGQQCAAQVILGSATPSLESWHHSRSADEGGRYLRLHMPERVGAAPMPAVHCIDMGQLPKRTLLAPTVLQAIERRIGRGEQTLLLLNQRGYAPVLHCNACGWKSACRHCSAMRVFHKSDRSLRCHHCAATSPVPHACPDCGNADISALGRGTEGLQEHLGEQLAHVLRPDGGPVRVARIDADTTRLKGALEAQLGQMHSGDIDVLIGTQMVAKGHDFQRISLVVAVNPDGALFSSDFRAPERLFALLLQAAGRAGRHASQGPSAMLVQTAFPSHSVFEALKRHDYPSFARTELAERVAAHLPPISHQALVRADAKTQDAAQGFLMAAQHTLRQWLSAQADGEQVLAQVTLYPCVPMGMQKVAGVERAQMLLESSSRKHLHRALARLQQVLLHMRQDPAHKPLSKGLIRWLVDVDPQAI